MGRKYLPVRRLARTCEQAYVKVEIESTSKNMSTGQSPAKRRKKDEIDSYESDSSTDTSSASHDESLKQENFGQNPTSYLSWTAWRSKLRTNSQLSTRVRVSQHNCKLANNKRVLLGWKSSTKDSRLIRRIDGLLAVLETLQLPSTYALQQCLMETGDGTFGERFGGLLEFNIAFEIYEDHAHLGQSNDNQMREDTMKSQFLLDLINDKFGIRCVILTLGEMRYIVLDSDVINLPSILSQIGEEFDATKKETKEIPYQLIRDGLAVMDSEFDKNICTSILSMLLPYGYLITCGINATIAKAKRGRMVDVFQELEEITNLSEQAVATRINERIDKLKEKLKVLSLVKRSPEFILPGDEMK